MKTQIYTTRIEKEHQEIKKRLDKNKEKIDFIKKELLLILGRKGFGKKCIKLAIAISKEKSIPIDRISKRSTPAVICWYCQNWITIKDSIIKFSNEVFLHKGERLSSIVLPQKEIKNSDGSTIYSIEQNQRGLEFLERHDEFCDSENEEMNWEAIEDQIYI